MPRLHELEITITLNGEKSVTNLGRIALHDAVRKIVEMNPTVGPANMSVRQVDIDRILPNITFRQQTNSLFSQLLAERVEADPQPPLPHHVNEEVYAICPWCRKEVGDEVYRTLKDWNYIQPDWTLTDKFDEFECPHCGQVIGRYLSVWLTQPVKLGAALFANHPVVYGERLARYKELHWLLVNLSEELGQLTQVAIFERFGWRWNQLPPLAEVARSKGITIDRRRKQEQTGLRKLRNRRNAEQMTGAADPTGTFEILRLKQQIADLETRLRILTVENSNLQGLLLALRK
ncbi:hypothetical protein HGA91_06460 [candidate division WWE3 bacterium]|nr:hypothetical protein [candidate division WWE3 bacterium]